eukprot:s3946_g9.t1
METVGTAVSFGAKCVGEGEFRVLKDRERLGPVMKTIVENKLRSCLQKGDLPGYRRHFNLQSVYLRGLQIEPVHDLVPGFELAPNRDEVVATFLHQNGFRGVCEADSAGWWPLHYAALSRNPKLIGGLLQQRADPNRGSTRDEPFLGFPMWTSALCLSVAYGHSEAARLLINSRARLENGLVPAMHFAAITDNAQGVRLLCNAGGRPLARNVLGVSALETAASYGAIAALQAMMEAEQVPMQEISRAAWLAACFRGGAGEVVKHLLSRRADMNFQLDLRRDRSRVGRLLYMAKALQHRRGRKTILSAWSYHMQGSTALMLAMQSANHEAAAALIAAGARLDLKNCRGWTAADFAKGQLIPAFLQQGLDGDPSECHRVAALAVPDGRAEFFDLLGPSLTE